VNAKQNIFGTFGPLSQPAPSTVVIHSSNPNKEVSALLAVKEENSKKSRIEQQRQQNGRHGSVPFPKRCYNHQEDDTEAETTERPLYTELTSAKPKEEEIRQQRLSEVS
jgi:hypothetical protein